MVWLGLGREVKCVGCWVSARDNPEESGGDPDARQMVRTTLIWGAEIPGSQCGSVIGLARKANARDKQWRS